MIKWALIGAAALSVTLPASATTLTFDELAYSSGSGSVFSADFVGSPYSTNGYTFTSTDGVLAGFDISRYSIWASDNPLNGDPGASTLVSNRDGALNTLTADGGGLFDITSIDLTDAFNGYYGGTGGMVRFYTDGDAANFTDISFDGLPGLQTFALAFKGVSSVSFIGEGTAYFQFDNVVLSSAAAVPEPASWAMMIAGFGLAGGALRSRRSAASPGRVMA